MNAWGDFDTDDHGTYLCPTHETMARRFMASARFHLRMARARGGIKGRQHFEEALWRRNVAKKLLARHVEISKRK